MFFLEKNRFFSTKINVKSGMNVKSEKINVKSGEGFSGFLPSHFTHFHLHVDLHINEKTRFSKRAFLKREVLR